MDVKGGETHHLITVYSSCSLLPTLHFAAEAAVLPLHPHLLAICPRGTAQIWSCEGSLSCRATYLALPPLGRFGL